MVLPGGSFQNHFLAVVQPLKFNIIDGLAWQLYFFQKTGKFILRNPNGAFAHICYEWSDDRGTG
jgi:hypothetical protein